MPEEEEKITLEKIFKNVEKPSLEKKPIIVETEQGCIDEIIGFFEKNRIEKNKLFPNLKRFENYIEEYTKFLRNKKITPKIIEEYINFSKRKEYSITNYDIGLAISSLLKVCYENGYRFFDLRKFGKIEIDGFGISLKCNDAVVFLADEFCGSNLFWGSKNIIVSCEKISGESNFAATENCFIDVKFLEGKCFLAYSKNAFLISDYINSFELGVLLNKGIVVGKKLGGNYNFTMAENLAVTIEEIEGDGNFYMAKHCVVNAANVNGNDNFYATKNVIGRLNEVCGEGCFIDSKNTYIEMENYIAKRKQNLEDCVLICKGKLI